ncbi:MAG TPA: DNA gyrase C-terminal beta-propeller domain-containing protein, partial [Chloroflexota bacterium]
LVTATAEGLLKKTPLEEYPVKGRATGGVQAMGITPKDSIRGIAVVDARDSIVIWTDGDDAIRVAARDIATAGRDRKGSRLAAFPKGAALEGLARSDS